MIALNNKIINNNIQNLFQKFESNVNEIKKDIENIKNFSDVLEVVSINKLDKNTDNDINTLYYIKAYEYELLTNDHSSYRCPLCKKDNTLSFHKTYTRNIILHINGYEVIARFTMIVLECSHCKEFNKGKQHFHALIPDFIFPYHIFSSNIIIKTLIDRFINKLKIEQILEKVKISHQLYYKWLNG